MGHDIALAIRTQNLIIWFKKGSKFELLPNSEELYSSNKGRYRNKRDVISLADVNQNGTTNERRGSVKGQMSIKSGDKTERSTE